MRDIAALLSLMWISSLALAWTFQKIKPHEWEKLPWRWVVERAFSWPNNSRRLSKDYEITTDSAEAIVKISYFHISLKRL